MKGKGVSSTMRIENLQNENRKFAKSIGNFHVLEYVQGMPVYHQ